MRDFSRAQVTLQPAEYASWSDARADLMVECKRPLKAQLSAELAAAEAAGESDKARDEITAAFAAREKALEHDLGACPDKPSQSCAKLSLRAFAHRSQAARSLQRS